MTIFRFALPFFILSLAACAPMAPRQADVALAPSPPLDAAQPTPPSDTQDSQPTPPSPGSGGRPKSPAPVVAPAVSPAVLALLREAEADSADGNLDNAAATLERAIRIQPRSALLWQKLAEVRLQQHQPGLAEDLAKKSNILGKGNAALTRKNWAIIADARRKKGDAEGAAEADAKAGR